jgi:flagellar biosynthesis protein
MSTTSIPLAVALQYERGKDPVPYVVATGKGEIGKKIIETARAHGVPIEENPGLAMALSELEVGDQIPEELFKAVAEVLMFILRLSGKVK